LKEIPVHYTGTGTHTGRYGLKNWTLNKYVSDVNQSLWLI
jgi:hypothetical protein